MPTRATRRPLPALAFLLALTILTAVVWWRVLHRDHTSSASTPTPTPPTVSCTTGKAKIVLPKPAAVTVRVLNGNGTVGLAGSVESQLKSRGFRSSGVADAPATIATVGELHYGAAGRNGASLLTYYLPGMRLVPIARADATVDVVLGKKFTTLAAQKAVTAAVTKATAGAC